VHRSGSAAEQRGLWGPATQERRRGLEHHDIYVDGVDRKIGAQEAFRDWRPYNQDFRQTPRDAHSRSARTIGASPFAHF